MKVAIIGAGNVGKALGTSIGRAGHDVESSSFLPAEADIAFLGLARAMGIPVLTYVRDAYQLFDDYRSAASVDRKSVV